MDYDIEFEWDHTKNLLNEAKHGVSFEEAREVFMDDSALLIDDPDHSEDEDRFVLIGSSSFRTLVVCRYRNDVIRIISARKANRIEAAFYVEGLKR